MFKIAWSPLYCLPLPEGHRFPMAKYNLLPEQLLYEGTITQENLFEPELMDESIITRIHTEEYWQKVKNLALSPAEIRKTGFPLSESLVRREAQIMYGTVQCTLFAIQHGIAMNIAGGTHHAFTDRGEGFCLLNDIAIAAQYLLDNRISKRILVIDLDVHQGNGTAEIFKNRTDVFTFSMHGANNYPMQKETSHWDIALPDGIQDDAYLTLLSEALPQLSIMAQPDHIFYQCGVDILATDKLGRLGVSREGCKQRDRMVLEFGKAQGVPITCIMGGGYSPKIADIIDAHAITFRLAQELF